jgi:hypothetical protein
VEVSQFESDYWILVNRDFAVARSFSFKSARQCFLYLLKVAEGVSYMCGMNWYREEMERADENLNRLNQLLDMMEQRYKLTPNASPQILAGLSSDIIAVYQEILSRRNDLLTPEPPKS